MDEELTSSLFFFGRKAIIHPEVSSKGNNTFSRVVGFFFFTWTYNLF